MKIIVPLAGPDFERPDGSVKAEMPFNGRPFLRAILEKRVWWRDISADGSDVIFVLRDTAASQRFAAEALKAWYPAARTVTLSAFSCGAALSSLAGVALTGHVDGPICLDLVDIDYVSDFAPATRFKADASAGAAALVFPSSNPVYSYLRTDEQGTFVEAAEKRVISNLASAGTYFFASPAIYLEALAHSLRNPAANTYNDLFFVCPVFNGVAANGRRVLIEHVTDVNDVKLAQR